MPHKRISCSTENEKEREKERERKRGREKERERVVSVVSAIRNWIVVDRGESSRKPFNDDQIVDELKILKVANLVITATARNF